MTCSPAERPERVPLAPPLRTTVAGVNCQVHVVPLAALTTRSEPAEVTTPRSNVIVRVAPLLVRTLNCPYMPPRRRRRAMAPRPGWRVAAELPAALSAALSVAPRPADLGDDPPARCDPASAPPAPRTRAVTPPTVQASAAPRVL